MTLSKTESVIFLYIEKRRLLLYEVSPFGRAPALAGERVMTKAFGVSSFHNPSVTLRVPPPFTQGRLGCVVFLLIGGVVLLQDLARWIATRVLYSNASGGKAVNRVVVSFLSLRYNNSEKFLFILNLSSSQNNCIYETGFNNKKGGTYGTRIIF